MPVVAGRLVSYRMKHIIKCLGRQKATFEEVSARMKQQGLPCRLITYTKNYQKVFMGQREPFNPSPRAEMPVEATVDPVHDGALAVIAATDAVIEPSPTRDNYTNLLKFMAIVESIGGVDVADRYMAAMRSLRGVL